MGLISDENSWLFLILNDFLRGEKKIYKKQTMLLLKLIAKKIFFFAILQISTTIPSTVRAIPKKFHGVDLIQWWEKWRGTHDILKSENAHSRKYWHIIDVCRHVELWMHLSRHGRTVTSRPVSANRILNIMSFSTIRRVAIVGAKKAPFRALSGGHEISTEAALSYTAKDAVEKVRKCIFKYQRYLKCWKFWWILDNSKYSVILQRWKISRYLIT